MSCVDPSIKPQFDSLSPALKNEILSRNVPLHTLQDLIQCLENIAQGAPSHPDSEDL